MLAERCELGQLALRPNVGTTGIAGCCCAIDAPGIAAIFFGNFIKAPGTITGVKRIVADVRRIVAIVKRIVAIVSGIVTNMKRNIVDG